MANELPASDYHDETNKEWEKDNHEKENSVWVVECEGKILSEYSGETILIGSKETGEAWKNGEVLYSTMVADLEECV